MKIVPHSLIFAALVVFYIDTMPPRKVKQVFLDTYTKQWPCIFPSKKGKFHAHCSVCDTDISIQHSGKYDINEHFKSKKHTENQALKGSNSVITNFISGVSDGPITAECMFADFLVEHNLPISITDHATPLFRRMFPDSKIAKEYASKRTKTTQIIHTFSKDIQSTINRVIAQEPYSISTDGSSDRGSENQLYPIVIRYYNSSLGRVVTSLHSLPAIEGASTGENIFQLMNVAVKENWKNCIAYCSDNAATMMGRKTGVAGHIARTQESVFITGCTCHLIHLAAGKAASKLPLKVNDLMYDVTHYMELSSKRVKGFKEFQMLCGADMVKLVKHCSTRWLSLEQSILRVLDQWYPLICFFTKEVEKMKPRSSKRKYDGKEKEDAKKVKNSEVENSQPKKSSTSSTSSQPKKGSSSSSSLPKQGNSSSSSGAEKTASKVPEVCVTNVLILSP